MVVAVPLGHVNGPVTLVGTSPEQSTLLGVGNVCALDGSAKLVANNNPSSIESGRSRAIVLNTVSLQAPGGCQAQSIGRDQFGIEVC